MYSGFREEYFSHGEKAEIDIVDKSLSIIILLSPTSLSILPLFFSLVFHDLSKPVQILEEDICEFRYWLSHLLTTLLVGEVLSFPDSPSLYISVEVTVSNSEASHKGSSQHRAGHTAVLKRWLLITPCYQPTSTASCQPMGGTCRATDGCNYYNDFFPMSSAFSLVYDR